MVHDVSGKSRLLVRFQDGCEKDMILNQLTILKVEKTPLSIESEVPTIDVIPDDSIDLEKGCYQGVYVILYFNNEGDIDRKEDQVDID